MGVYSVVGAYLVQGAYSADYDMYTALMLEGKNTANHSNKTKVLKEKYAKISLRISQVSSVINNKLHK